MRTSQRIQPIKSTIATHQSTLNNPNTQHTVPNQITAACVHEDAKKLPTQFSNTSLSKRTFSLSRGKAPLGPPSHPGMPDLRCAFAIILLHRRLTPSPQITPEGTNCRRNRKLPTTVPIHLPFHAAPKTPNAHPIPYRMITDN